jgi:histidinol dehydrogenase
MQKILEPKQSEWGRILERPSIDSAELYQTVSEILANVRENGDDALRFYSNKFDPVAVDDLVVTQSEFRSAESAVSESLKDAIKAAKTNIEAFHTLEGSDPAPVETMSGVVCRRRTLPIEKVGLYIPAGSAPLFSTVLMLAIPAKLARCSEIVLCSPPNADGSIEPATLHAAQICGVEKVFKTGGAQAIAAMAFGTETIPRVYKIFGPGNQYVTEAKLHVMRYGTAIDLPAGPSELAVLADETGEPEFIAADLLSQAEHGPDSQVLLVSDSMRLIDAVIAEIERQIEMLPRREIARAAIANSKAIFVDGLETGIALLNEYAPEHLIVATSEAEVVAERFTNVGSVFIGNYSPESAGDYASGTNHTLPTGGAARAFSGVSTSSFMKTITYQTISKDGLRALGPIVETMAAGEGLEAHKRAVSIRLRKIEESDGI